MEDLFTDNGPTKRAAKLFRVRGGPCSTGETIMLELAFAVWNGQSMDASLSFGDLFRLDSVNLRAVGEMLAAAAAGAGDLDAWCRDWMPSSS